MGLYNASGAYNITLVGGTDVLVPRGIFAPDGSLRVTTDAGLGLYAPNGVIRINSSTTLASAPDGAWGGVVSGSTFKPNSSGVGVPTIPPTNILLNGDFSAGTANWNGFGFNGKSVVASQGVFAATGQFDGVTQSITPVNNKYYELSYTLSSWVSGSMAPGISGGSGQGTPTVRSGNGTFVERFLTGTGNTLFVFQSNSTITTNFDNLSLIGPYNTVTVGGA